MKQVKCKKMQTMSVMCTFIFSIIFTVLSVLQVQDNLAAVATQNKIIIVGNKRGTMPALSENLAKPVLRVKILLQDWWWKIKIQAFSMTSKKAWLRAGERLQISSPRLKCRREEFSSWQDLGSNV